MSFQRLSERVEGKSRPPECRWKVVPQSRTGGRETHFTDFVMCSWHKQLPQICGIGPQWATANVRQKATVVCEGRGSQSDKRLMHEPRVRWSDVTASVVTKRSPFCGYNMTQCLELRGEIYCVIQIILNQLISDNFVRIVNWPAQRI